MKTINEVIEKHFGDKRTIYPMVIDAHKNIEGDFYIAHDKYASRTEIICGGDNGEICICVTDDPEKLDTLLTVLISR